MDVTSVEGLLVALLVVVPGAAGDALMRRLLDKPRPKNGFSELLRAVLWSGAALAVMEVFARVRSGDGQFGDYLLSPISRISERSAVVDLTGAYVGYLTVAVVLPVVAVYIADWTTRRLTNRTPDSVSFDELFEHYAPETPEGYVYVVADLGEDEVEGWLLWRSTGDVDDRALILRDFRSHTVTLVPFEYVKSLTVVDPTETDPTDEPAANS